MKKILSIALAVIMVTCIAATAFAASSTVPKITGMAQSLSVGYSGNTDLGSIAPQDNRVEYIDLTDVMFTWDDSSIPTATPAALTATQIRNSKLTVRATNGRVLDSVSINTNKSRIEVKFLEEMAGTKEIDFDFDIVLSVDGHRQSDFAINFYGTLANPVYEVYAGTEYEDISNGEVIEAMEYIKSIVLDAGSGVSITTKMMKGNRSYATATITPDEADEAVLSKYKTIQDVINLKAVGISQSATVNLGAEYKDYYVYSKDGDYVGRGNAGLVLTDKYYIAREKADDFVKDNSKAPGNGDNQSKPAENSEISSPGSTSNTASSSYPTNIHNNPNTGR